MECQKSRFLKILFSEVFLLQNVIDTTAILYQSIEQDLLYKALLIEYLFVLTRGSNSRYIMVNHQFFVDSDIFLHLSGP
jgi:hypothetical protein